MSKVRVIDRGMNSLLREFQAAGKGSLCSVGVQGVKAGERDEGEGVTNVEVGYAHEYGKGRIPERSHFRAVFDANESKYRAQLDKVVREFVSVAKARGDIRMAGEDYQRHVLNFMKAGIAGGREGIVRYLYKTSQYWQSITVVMDHVPVADE
jgi:hypothetical protein